ncbi:transcription factor SPN1 [Pancytospora philotis]|nr:transcription factor SPN1 [Pancytospora philotis]
MATEEKQAGRRRRAVVDSSEDEQVPVAPASAALEQTPKPSQTVSLKDAPARPKRTAARQPKLKVKATAGESAEQYAFELLNTMKDIYRKDIAAFGQKKPALLRIKAVEDIALRIIRSDTQDACIKLGVLREIKQWLEPLPDNSLPSQKIKKVLLETLYNMRVGRFDLVSSGVGKIVYFYSRNMHEAKDVRKLARELVLKWKALVIRDEMDEEEYE